MFLVQNRTRIKDDLFKSSTAADLLRLDSHRFQCKSCGKSFPSSQQMSINSLAESQPHSEMAGSGESLDSQFCSASSCFLTRILDNPCPTHINGGVPSTPPRFFARPILSGWRGFSCRYLWSGRIVHDSDIGPNGVRGALPANSASRPIDGSSHLERAPNQAACQLR